MINIRYALNAGACAPTKAYAWDAGFDLRATSGEAVVEIEPGGSHVFDTGVHFEIPEGYVGLVMSKSGLYINRDMICTGVVDAGYTGTVHVKLCNLGGDTQRIYPGNKVGQIIFMEIPGVELLEIRQISGGPRGDNGFGSTGR